MLIQSINSLVILHYFLNDVRPIYLKASPLPPAPLAVADLLVAGLVAWQYSDQLAGVLASWICLFGFRLLVLFVGAFAE